jgi:putative DNA primase/helicase
MFNERHTDAGNARWFARAFGDQVRYVRERGKWIMNVGTHWADDVDGAIERMAKAAISGIFDTLGEFGHQQREQRDALYKHATRSEAAPRIAAALSLFKSEAGVTISQAQLDPDPMLLGVRNGVVDLRTGTFRQPRGDEYVTRQAGCDFQPQAKCPTWNAFLARIMNDDIAMIEFLQRALGYSLTGDASEQAMFINFGHGQNGKSVFMGALKDLLGAYAANAPAGTFLDRRDTAASNDIARLAHARLVYAAEIDEGRSMAEALVKLCTGGEHLVARYLFQEFFEFQPQFKLWLACNHRPRIRGSELAIWRRIRLIPFAVTIPEAEQDRRLPAKLRLELPGLLNWAIAGCLAWQRDGLEAPAAVINATEQYRFDSDVLANWLLDSCFMQQGVSAQATLLYGDYRKFTEDRGSRAMSMRTWADRMAERGFEKRDGRSPKRAGVVMYDGVGLRRVGDSGEQFLQPSLYNPSRKEEYETRSQPSHD